jgi:hypothetical protein
MLDVPQCFDQCDQFAIYAQLQYRCAGVVDASGCDLLFDLCFVEKV